MYEGGILWNETKANTYSTVSCQQAGDQFVPGLSLTRECFYTGTWSVVDFTNCTLRENVSSFASISVVLEGDIDVQNNRTILETTVSYIKSTFNCVD